MAPRTGDSCSLGMQTPGQGLQRVVLPFSLSRLALLTPGTQNSSPFTVHTPFFILCYFGIVPDRCVSSGWFLPAHGHRLGGQEGLAACVRRGLTAEQRLWDWAFLFGFVALLFCTSWLNLLVSKKPSICPFFGYFVHKISTNNLLLIWCCPVHWADTGESSTTQALGCGR